MDTNDKNDNTAQLQALLESLTPLSVPIPPMLETTLGYTGQAQFVGFWWEPMGDELEWDDGTCSVCGAEWSAWLYFIWHRAVAPHLEEFDFGSSDAPARHGFLLDRTARVAYAGPRRSVRQVLMLQATAQERAGAPVPARTEAAATFDQLHPVIEPQGEAGEAAAFSSPDAVFTTGWREVTIAPAELERRINASRQREQELRAWLDALLPATEQGV